jgi:hypothetical protein
MLNRFAILFLLRQSIPGNYSKFPTFWEEQGNFILLTCNCRENRVFPFGSGKEAFIWRERAFYGP